jgi:tRNA (guanosine-2'-O-)-methyltransferase
MSEEAAEAVDNHIIIPMVGMVQSLNVSAAASNILFEAQRQRFNAGMYDQRRISDELYEELFKQWTLTRQTGKVKHALREEEKFRDGVE